MSSASRDFADNMGSLGRPVSSSILSLEKRPFVYRIPFGLRVQGCYLALSPEVSSLSHGIQQEKLSSGSALTGRWGFLEEVWPVWVSLGLEAAGYDTNYLIQVR